MHVQNNNVTTHSAVYDILSLNKF